MQSVQANRRMQPKASYFRNQKPYFDRNGNRGYSRRRLSRASEQRVVASRQEHKKRDILLIIGLITAAIALVEWLFF